MAYRIDYALHPGEDFHTEFRLVDHRTKKPVSVTGVEHSFGLFGDGVFWDYGHHFEGCGPILGATEFNGMITTYEPGVVVIDIPSCSLPRCASALRFRFSALRPDVMRSFVIATGTISFGGCR